MSAIQLLEKIGANPKFAKEYHLASGKSSNILDKIEIEKSKNWCLFFPAEDDKEDSEDKNGNEEEKDNSITPLH